MSNDFRYRYSLVACARWEEKDVLEWVQYHWTLGFDHIYLYSNDDDPMPTFRVLTPYLFGPAPFITFRHVPKRDPRTPQQADIYFHFLRNYKHETEWFSFLDIDEFLVLKGVNDVHAFMEEFKQDYDAIYFNWLIYGSNGKPGRDCESVLLSHTRRNPQIDMHTKVLVRSGLIDEKSTRERFKRGARGFWHFWNEYDIPGMRSTNVIRHNVDQYTSDYPNWAVRYVRQPGVSEAIIDKAYVAHFQFKSEQDFARRVQRGGSHTVAYWQKILEDQTYQKRLAANDTTIDVYLARYWLEKAGAALAFTTERGAPLPPYNNVALRKPSFQSSVRRSQEDQPGRSWPVGHANNGVRTGGYGFATRQEEAPWWVVDLLECYRIHEVHVYNRIDTQDMAARADQIAIEISMDMSEWSRIFALGGKPFGGIDSSPLIVKLNERARFVRIISCKPTTLHLDEIEVYGEPGADLAV